MRYFGVPESRTATSSDEFRRHRISTSRTPRFSYEDDSIRLKADWQASDNFALAGRAVSADVRPVLEERRGLLLRRHGRSTLERWDPLMIGHDMDHTGAAHELRVLAVGGGVARRSGFEMNDVSFERPTNFCTPANPNGITFDEFDTVDPFNFQPGVLADITTAPFLPDNTSDVSQWAVFGEAQFNLDRPLRHRRRAAHGRLRHADRARSAGPASTSRSMTSRAASAWSSTYPTTPRCTPNTAPAATHPSSSIVTGSRQQSRGGHDRERAARDRHQASGDGTGLQLERRVVRHHQEQLDRRRPDARATRRRHR